MNIESKTLINRVQSKFYRDQMSSLALSFERFMLSASTCTQINNDANLLGSRATVAVKLKKDDRVEIIHIESRITDVDMEHIISHDGEEYMYNIKLKDAMIHIGDKYSTDDLLGQTIPVKLLLKSNKEKEN